MKILTTNLLGLIISTLLSSVSYANEQPETIDEGNFFGNFRIGYIASEDDSDNSETSSAFGGKLGYISTTWHGLSAGGTLYATQKLFNDENGDFFASDGESYAILGEVFAKAQFGQTEVKAGRFEFDSPHADTDDIRMVPNTFSGAVISNTDIAGTTLYAIYLKEWSGVDSEIPEDFTDLNGDDGIYAVGAEFEGVENLDLQGWFYHGNDFAQLAYAEAIYELGDLILGAQLASQTDKTSDLSGPDGDVFGVMASYNLSNFTLSAAYNGVSGMVTNGFGGGPFFTSSADYTIADVEDQKALAVGVDYSGIDKLTLSALHVDFDQGENETDFIATYEFSEDADLEMIYSHMYDDGKIFLVRVNVGF